MVLAQYGGDDPAVRLPENTLAFLKRGGAPTARATAEAIAGQPEAVDAYRWAVLHLALHNPNYAPAAAQIGPAVAAGRAIAFADAFGPVGPQFEFEYGLFLENLEQGLRPDLTAWDWKANPRPLKRRATARVDARGGWQPTRTLLTAGQRVLFETTGDWTVGAPDPVPPAADPAAEPPAERDAPDDRPDAADVTADGGPDGRGRLVAALFDPQTLALSDEFELAASGTLVAPAGGHLMLRARDAWGQLRDNRGRITVKLEPAE